MKRGATWLHGFGLAVFVAAAGLVVIAAAVGGASADQSRTLDLAASPPPSPTHRIELEGRVEGEGTAIIVLRIDDHRSRDYATRANHERVFPVGSFRWQVSIGGVADMRGRVLDLAQLQRVQAFKAGGSAGVRIDRLALVEAPALPPGSRGYAFGARDAPLPAGFERIAPDDARIRAGAGVAIRRPLPDPLVANGLRGVSRVQFPWPRGRARVTLWTEDPGAWELLPHPLSRRIVVNGETVLREEMTAESWIRQRYLRNRGSEHAPDSDAWQAFGKLRGEERSTEVDVDDDGVTIDLSSNDPGGAFISAVLISPVDENAALASVRESRATWYRDNWPVLASDIQISHADVHKWQLSERREPGPAVELRAAPGTGERLRIQISGLQRETTAKVRVNFNGLDSTRVSTLVWAARERLERRRAQDSFLTRTGHALHGDEWHGPAPGSDRRLYEMWVDVAAATLPGRHRGQVTLEAGAQTAVLPIILEVLPDVLPAAAKPVGPYLDESPHFTWFAGLEAHRERQLDCDAAFVVRVGLTGAAPSIAAPHLGGGTAFRKDLRRAAASGLVSPVLAYAAAKRTFHGVGAQSGAGSLADAVRGSHAAGLEPPIWSLADEPSNASAGEPWIDWLAAVRSHAGQPMRIAGHLNARGDRALLSKFDVVLINGGFGLDLDTIAAARAAGPVVWLYNTEAPRLTAGAWLWRSAAVRYVQWHARMPTADPFDPLDGREGDEQLILPSDAACPATPSIHRDLLDLAEGVVDQRWLQWLDAQSTPAARQLQSRLLARLGADWAQATRLARNDLRAMRESIIAYAISMQAARQ